MSTESVYFKPMAPKITRILLADDQEVAREGYRRILEAEDGLEVVAAAADGLEAVQLAELQCPDVAVLDIRMPRLIGIEAAKRIRQACPQVGIVLLSFYDDPRYARAFLSRRRGRQGVSTQTDNWPHQGAGAGHQGHREWPNDDGSNYC